MENFKLPFNFVVELTTFVTRIVSEVIQTHKLDPSPRNMYEIGKQISAIGLTICASSKYADRDTTIKDMTEIHDGVSKSIGILQEAIAANTKATNKNLN